MDGIKICTKCRVEKHYADFYTRKDSKQGYYSNCKSCIRGRNMGRSEEKRLDNKKASAENEEDVIKLNHFTNLQPLCAKDNLQKGASMPAFLNGSI